MLQWHPRLLALLALVALLVIALVLGESSGLDTFTRNYFEW